MPKGSGHDQTVDGGYCFFQAGQQSTPFVHDACIDGQNTVFEPCGQVRFKPRGYPRTAATALELLNPLADFAERQDADEQRLRPSRVEPFRYAGRRLRLEQFGQRAGIDQKGFAPYLAPPSSRYSPACSVLCFANRNMPAIGLHGYALS